MEYIIDFKPITFNEEGSQLHRDQAIKRAIEELTEKAKMNVNQVAEAKVWDEDTKDPKLYKEI